MLCLFDQYDYSLKQLFFYFNVFKNINDFDVKAEFSASLLWSSVSHDAYKDMKYADLLFQLKTIASYFCGDYY